METAAPERSERPTARALDAEGVRSVLRRRRAARIAVVAIGVLALAVAVVGIRDHHRDNDAVRRRGVEVTGRVLTASGSRVTVAYERSGRTTTFTASLDGSGPRFRVGQRILVIVDPKDPDYHRVKGQARAIDWTPILLGALGVAGLLLAVIGAIGLARGRREARLLRSGPWRHVGMRTARRTAPPGLGRYVTLVNESGREHVLGVTSTGLGDGTMRSIYGRDRAEIVGDPRRRIVLRPEGGSGFVSARPAPNSTVDRRWRLALGAPPRR